MGTSIKFPPWLSEIERELVKTERREGDSDRRNDDRISFPRSRRKGFHIPKLKKRICNV